MSLATELEGDQPGWEVMARRPGSAFDRRRAEAAVTELLAAVGRDTDEPNLADTPRRVAAAYRELLERTPLRLTTFPNEDHYDALVLVRDIPFTSLCAHHLLPFRGVAHVGYLPGERLLGLSKLARVVEYFSRDLQLQERLTMQIADCLEAELTPGGVGVVIEAEHLCMSIRGVRAAGARTRTSRFTGGLASSGGEHFAASTASRG